MTVRRVRYARSALRDLANVAVWIARDDPAAATRYLGRLRLAVFSLADMPEMGRRRDELAPGLRSFPVASHVIFYRVDGDNLSVVRVIRGQRDIDAIFGGR